MKLRRLITTKPHKYGTRHLTAGDEYEVPPKHAAALVAGRKAKFAPDKSARATTRSTALVSVEEKAEAHAAMTVTGVANEAAVKEAWDRAGPLMTTDSLTGLGRHETALDRLRAEAAALGIEYDRRWGTVRLQHEIAQAKR